LILTAPQSDLSTALEKVEFALSSGIAVHRQVLLDCTGEWVVFSAHNTTTAIKTAIPIPLAEEGDRLLLPPEAIRAVKAMPPGDVTLSKKDGRLILKSSLGPKYQLGYGNPADYMDVVFSKKTTFKIGIEQLLRAIRYRGAYRTDTVLITGQHFITTDKFRMTVVTHLGTPPWEAGEQVVVPSGFFPLAEKVLDSGGGDVDVIVQNNRVTFRQGMNAISTLRSDAKFPSFQTALDSFDLLGHFETTREDLLAACDRASVIARGHLPMKLDLKSKKGGEVSAFRTDVGTSEETLVGDWHVADYSIAFNAGMLRAMVSVLAPGDVRLSFDTNPKNMFHLDGPDDEQVGFVMMPMMSMMGT